MMKKILITIILLFPWIVSAQANYQGELISPENSSAVYYISADNQSYSFPNEKIYFSWFENFDFVQKVSSTTLKQYEYNGNIQYKPQEYENLNYILIDGTLVKQKNGPGIFYIQNGKKRVFTNLDTLEANSFNPNHAIIADISEYPWGITIGDVEEGLSNNFNFIEPLIKQKDSDTDGLNDYDEKYFYHTDLMNPDTDGDKIKDGEEIQNKMSPLGEKSLIQTDTDKDYLNDFFEIQIGTDLMNPDTDGDLYLDGTEVAASYDPINPNPDAQVEKKIKVNIANQKLEYYFGDKLIDSFLISSGISGMDTPTGEFSILGKEESKDYGGAGYDFYYPDTKWNLHFYTGQYRFYIHGAYWHNNFGHKMSHGCINVHYDNMEPLYWWTNIGTKVIIE